MNTPLQKAAQSMIDRWDSPYWKLAPTAHYVAELRKALDAEIAQPVEPEVLMVDAAMVEMKNIVPPLRRSECLRLIRAAINATAHPPQPQATTPKSDHLSDFDMRGVLASNLLCWNRLTEAEAQDLVCFFEKVRTTQGEKPTVDEPEEEDLYALALKADNWGQP